jgi:hypothetical protein
MIGGMAEPSDPASDSPTDDEKWLVVEGRRWRSTDPSIPAEVLARLKSHLGRGRSGVRTARDDAEPEATRHRTQLAKVGLGERHPVVGADRRRASRALGVCAGGAGRARGVRRATRRLAGWVVSRGPYRTPGRQLTSWHANSSVGTSPEQGSGDLLTHLDLAQRDTAEPGRRRHRARQQLASGHGGPDPSYRDEDLLQAVRARRRGVCRRG